MSDEGSLQQLWGAGGGGVAPKASSDQPGDHTRGQFYGTYLVQRVCQGRCGFSRGGRDAPMERGGRLGDVGREWTGLGPPCSPV